MITSLFSGCVNNSTEEEQIEYNTDFSFNLLTSEKINVSRYAGKIVLVDFTGVNCPYCVPQMFVLENIYNNYRNDDLVILSIYVWMVLGETIQDINNLIDAYRCSSPCDAEDNFSNVQLRDAKEYYGKQDGLELNWIFGYDDSVGTLYNEYGKKGIPYLLILDKKGNIYYSKAGYTDYNSLTIKLDELIG
jgi:thiol-disulfide isomerase/thioredoxin